ncbi:Hypothetical predicted protein [Paramuricea clavata]|uniref:Uncharacterized protein n=1 Tax=Paramuricea clavata TaxID=317549 RepID=A0A6S7IY71_PARCT|nr:Hypothetical predicted protein [Paramuricea clavata]
MENRLLSIPNEEVIPGTSKLCNYHIIGDDAFPLQKDLMKPLPYKSDDRAKRIYNYRLSRARRVVENAFVDNEDFNHQVILGAWRTDQQLTGLQPTRNRNSACSAKSQRDALKEYFSSALGAVPWQNEMK